jgi:hypothetical protein
MQVALQEAQERLAAPEQPRRRWWAWRRAPEPAAAE